MDALKGLGTLSNKNALIIYSPHVIQDVYVFLSSGESKVFDENIPGCVSIECTLMDSKRLKVKMTVSVQLQRAIMIPDDE